MAALLFAAGVGIGLLLRGTGGDSVELARSGSPRRWAYGSLGDSVSSWARMGGNRQRRWR